MNKAAIFHRSTREYLLPTGRRTLFVRLLAAREDIANCEIVYWKRSAPLSIHRSQLTLAYRACAQDDYRVTLALPETAHYIKYYFCLTDAANTVQYFCDAGYSSEPPKSGHFEHLYTNDGDIAKIPAWSRGIVYYQIFPERFEKDRGNDSPRIYDPWDALPTRENFLGGNLKGILRRLPYLQELGVDCLYLTPIFAGDFNHKYATTDYYRIDPDFGTLDDLKTLTSELHACGMRILLDGVFNHVGGHFPPFEDVLRNGADSLYADWFYAESYPLSTEPLNYACVGDYPYMPKLKTEHPSVCRMVLDVMKYWIREAAIDGWRLDVADEVASGAWQLIRAELKREYPDALLLGETWGDAWTLIGSGRQLDSAMNYLFREATLDFFCRQTIDAETFDDRIQRMFSKYPDHVLDGLYNCLGSHDTARLLTEAHGNEDSVKLAIAFQMACKGSPAVYYGDEIGMSGGNDPGCRGGMRWNQDQQRGALLQETKAWIRLRKQHAALRTGRMRSLLCKGDLYAFVREDEQEQLAFAFNRGGTPATVTLADFAEEAVLSPRSVKIIMKNGGNHA